MVGIKGFRWKLPAMLLILCGLAVTVQAGVDLEWRPAAQIAHVGDQVEIGLYAVSNSGSDHRISAMDVLVFNSPEFLEFQSISPAGAPYSWLISDLLSSAPEKINQNIYDGKVLYSAWARLGVPAVVPPSGLLVTTFCFTAQSAVTETEVTIPSVYGSSLKTAVFDGTVPNLDITGTKGSARVMIVPNDVAIVSSVVEAKSLACETELAFVGPVVTRSFGNFFYIEDADRTSGIRVNCTGAVPPEGSVPMIRGILRLMDNEPVIDQASVGLGYDSTIPRPYVITTRSAFSGLTPRGLLVTIGGVIGSGAEPEIRVIQDGSPQPVTLDLYGVVLPEDGHFRIITGILGINQAGSVLRVNNQDDIRPADE